MEINLKLRQKSELKDGVHYAVDRIEGEILVLENLDTGEMIEIKNDIDAKESDILVYIDGQLLKDELEYAKRKERIKNKLERLKR